jgi:rod shape-determining protein MreC
MENFFTRYRNPVTLGAILLLQIIGLAVQVKRPTDPRRADSGSVRLIRLWATGAIMPVERLLVTAGESIRRGWHDYVNLSGLRSENRSLHEENQQLQIELAKLSEDANQAHRLQSLLGFKEQFVTQTLAAQVLSTSGSEQSRVVYIDKGSQDGLQPDMAVITPQGIVGKVRDVFRSSSQVLLIDDSLSGVGAILKQARLYGVVKGNGVNLYLDHVMSDEKVSVGDEVISSGGDGIFPKGLLIGTVAQVTPGPDLFLRIRVKPSTDLNRLEEVLVITQVQSQTPEDMESRSRAADILAQRLPGLKTDQIDARAETASSKSTGGDHKAVNSEKTGAGAEQQVPVPLKPQKKVASAKGNTPQ